MVPHLCNSLVIQNNSVGALSNGLLAELPTVLDSSFTSTTNDYLGVEGSHKGAGNMLCSYTCDMDQLVLEMAQKVVKSVDNITTRSCKTL